MSELQDDPDCDNNINNKKSEIEQRILNDPLELGFLVPLPETIEI